MAIVLERIRGKADEVLRYPTAQRLQVYFVGAAVLFASLGLGEAVYRLLFSDFDGAKDRLPIEAFFGLVFAWLATKLARSAYKQRKETEARLNLIWDRNHQIRHAVEAICPQAHASKNQQSIRVIREEVERIEGALKDVLPR